MIKVVTLFLIVVVTLAMFGKLGWLGNLAPKGKSPLPKPRTCPDCGRLVIGKGGCDCGGPSAKKG